MVFFVFFFFKQKTAYEMRISDWSSDVCSSDLHRIQIDDRIEAGELAADRHAHLLDAEFDAAVRRDQRPWCGRNGASEQQQRGCDDSCRYEHYKTPSAFWGATDAAASATGRDRKSTRLNSSH